LTSGSKEKSSVNLRKRRLKTEKTLRPRRKRRDRSCSLMKGRKMNRTLMTGKA